ncbi:unnamed protein product [Oreochromis niloticus]|nr:unnamed protein product [Mustela putorius furo]
MTLIQKYPSLKSGCMPRLAAVNGLELQDIPAELCDLNILERHLIAKCIPFAKIIPLPKGRQRLIRGNVVCVPSEVQQTVDSLPRLRSQSQIMRIKLKRRLCYKGHQLFQTVTWSKLIQALRKLKQIHPQYTDIVIRDDALLCDPTLPDDDSSDEASMGSDDYDEADLMEIDNYEKDALLCESESESEQDIDMVSCDEQPEELNPEEPESDLNNGGFALESCLQPVDISEEILSFTDNTYCVAPAERNNPVSFFRTPHLEAMAFPVQFPTDHSESVKRVVKRNKDKYEKNSEDIESALEEFEQNRDVVIDEWCNLAPESEVVRLQCDENLPERHSDDENEQENVPDYSRQSDAVTEIRAIREQPAVDPAVDLDEKKIYANPEVTAALQTMRQASVEEMMPLLQVRETASRPDTLTLIHHNTEGLPSHISDIKSHHEMCLADVLCLTESHLQGSFVADSLHLDGYTMFKRNRHVSYTNFPQMASRSGGGVVVYLRNHFQVQVKQYLHNVTDLEFLVLKVQAPFPALIAVVYRPPDYSLTPFMQNLVSLLDSLEIMDCHPIIVCGDFNENQLQSGRKQILEQFQSRGYSQLITSATTDKNTLLDLIFISQPQQSLYSGVLRTYYSYHNPVFCVLSSSQS